MPAGVAGHIIKRFHHFHESGDVHSHPRPASREGNVRAEHTKEGEPTQAWWQELRAQRECGTPRPAPGMVSLIQPVFATRKCAEKWIPKRGEGLTRSLKGR